MSDLLDWFDRTKAESTSERAERGKRKRTSLIADQITTNGLSMQFSVFQHDFNEKNEK